MTKVNHGDPKNHANYDARYFDEELHRAHWFRNNAAKRNHRWQAVLKMIEPAATDRVLDIGCAVGLHTLELAAHVASVVGMDLASEAVARARSAALSQGIQNATFVEGDASDLSGFGNETFDKVAAIDFVEHVNDAMLESVLAEVLRVLTTGGRIAIYTPCATHYVERLKAHDLILRQIPGHIGVRGPEAYRDALQRAGFEVRALRLLPSDYPLAGRLDRLLIDIPLIGAWFQFRICIVGAKPAR